MGRCCLAPWYLLYLKPAGKSIDLATIFHFPTPLSHCPLPGGPPRPITLPRLPPAKPGKKWVLYTLPPTSPPRAAPNGNPHKKFHIFSKNLLTTPSFYSIIQPEQKNKPISEQSKKPKPLMPEVASHTKQVWMKTVEKRKPKVTSHTIIGLDENGGEAKAGSSRWRAQQSTITMGASKTCKQTYTHRETSKGVAAQPL